MPRGLLAHTYVVGRFMYRILGRREFLLIGQVVLLAWYFIFYSIGGKVRST